MPIPPPRRKIDVEEATRLHDEDGLSAAAIARRLGFRESSVRRALKRAGVALRPERTPGSVPHGRKLYSIWYALRSRCTNPEHPQFARHGGRGFVVCTAWSTFWPFYDWAIASGYWPGLGIDVVEPAKLYSPRTSRWITRSERARCPDRGSSRPPVHRIRAWGEWKSASEWARDGRCKVSAATLLARIQRGVSPKDALVSPPEQGRGLASNPRRAVASRPRRLLDWGEIVRLHVDEELEPDEIARIVGAKRGTIVSGLRARGVRRTAAPLAHRVRLRNVWAVMRRRCEDKSSSGFEHYGAKGARVSKGWHDFRAFHRWAIESGYEPGLVLTRRPGTRVYCPANCRWATREEADRAAKLRSKATYTPRHMITAFGEEKGPTEWSRDPRCHVSLTALLHRLRRGMAPEDAIATPPKGGRGRRDTPWVFITAFGETKGLSDWSRDRRCKVTLATLRERLTRGVQPEVAIAAAAYRLAEKPPARARH